ncbi:MAG TPA: DoxX family protein, partial [Acidimicrobiales bacterium]|nr:DoxX family protein [Acidimicrobiales bacterium]
AEALLGGSWDIARIPSVRHLVVGLGYPSYFLVLLGAWKLLGGIALLIPRRPLLKEWAYAGTFFVYTGAIASHLSTGHDVGEVGALAVLTSLTIASWALRPPSRRTGR